MPGKKNRVFLNILTLIITLGLCFLLGETWLRWQPQVYCEGYRPSRNDKIVYELLPNYRLESLKADISAQGLNDRVFSLLKPQDIFRIAVVGDSTSFGWKVERKNSFPKILERLLNQNPSGKVYEVMNFSVPGYNTSQECELIKEKVMRFHPDMVLLIFCGNDVHICNFFKPRLTALNYFYNKSYLVHFLLQRVDSIVRRHTASGLNGAWASFKKDILGMFYYGQRIYPFPGLEETEYIALNPPGTQENVPSQYWHMLGYDNYKKHLSNIFKILKQKNIEFVSSGFLTPPALAAHRELGIEYICDFFEFAPPQDFEKRYLVDGHLNEEGNARVAQFLYDFLTRNSLLGPAGSPG